MSIYEIACDDCGKHLGWLDPIGEYGQHCYCDGCAVIRGVEGARKYIPTIIIDESTNVSAALPAGQ